MKTVRVIALLGLGLSVSACAAVDVPTRNAPFETLPPVMSSVQAPDGMRAVSTIPDFAARQETAFNAVNSAPLSAPAPVATTAPVATAAPVATSGPALTPSPYRVNTVSVHVPPSLEVSEANSYFPGGDIVWREDPLGNRHAQVQAIVQNAMLRGATQITGPRAVNLEVIVRRFHALSEKARYAAGGVHNITLELTVRDAATGAVLRPTKTIRADLEALGGKPAIMAERRGVTQKVRITGHLAEVLRQELSSPNGYVARKLGIMSIFAKS